MTALPCGRLQGGPFTPKSTPMVPESGISDDAENELEAPLCLDAPAAELNYKVPFWPRFRSRH